MSYAATATKVKKTLAAKGKPATIIRPGDATGWTKSWDALGARWQWTNDVTFEVVYVDPAVDTEINGSVLELQFKIGQIDGTIVKQGDRLFMGSFNAPPVNGDTMRVGGTDITIVGLSPLTPGDTVLYWEVQAR